MNKIIKVLLIVFLVILLVSVAVYSKLFIIGNKSYESISIESINMVNNKVEVNASYTDSARAYKSYDYKLVGTELYITVNSVLVSKKYPSGTISISIDLPSNQVQRVYLSDDKSAKVIYEK